LSIFASLLESLEENRMQLSQWAVDDTATVLDRSLSIDEAQTLTERIKTATQEVCLLLLEAHQRRAWVPLGYRSWREYVRSELGLSRSRSYELLDQARVVRVLQKEARTSQLPDISPYAAGQIRPHLAEVTQMIRIRSANLAEEHVTEVVAEVIREVRTRVVVGQGAARTAVATNGHGHEAATELAEREPAPAPLSDGIAEHRQRQVDPVRLSAAIQSLANMPPAREVAARIPEDEAYRLDRLKGARRRLGELASRWSQRRW
jgi:hypothetical protein